MRFWLATGFSIACLGVATRALAEEPSPRRYEAALRLGYSAGNALGVPGFTFLELDAAYHLSPRWSLGPYAEVGFIDSVVPQRQGTGTFLGHHYRFGGQASLQLLPKGLIDPWLGAGIGYAALGVDVHPASASAAVLPYRETARGLEWLNLQCGASLNLAPQLSLGAFARVSFVDYLSQHRQPGEPHAGLSAWLSAGAKATLRF